VSSTMILLDPTNERVVAKRQPVDRLHSLTGVTVGLLDIFKPRGDIFLGRVEELLRARGVEVKRYQKPTFAKPAPLSLRQKIASECGAVIEALAD